MTDTKIRPEVVVTKDRPQEWGELPEDFAEFMRSDNGIMSRFQKEVMDRIVANQWFLVKNELGAKIKGELRPRPYLTLGGLELPFNGMNNLMLVLNSYDEYTRERLISAMRPGTIEPITKEKATELVRKIQAKGYLIYPLLTE